MPATVMSRESSLMRRAICRRVGPSRRRSASIWIRLAALANLGVGLPYFLAKAIGAGAGRAVAVTYEYGNTFVIVAGLLNMLAVLDAYDISQGRK